MRRRLIGNPLAASERQDGSSREERLLNVIFGNYEALDTLDALHNALHNVEMAHAAAERWIDEHVDREQGTPLPVDGMDAKTVNRLVDSMDEERYALRLLCAIYGRREDLLLEVSAAAGKEGGHEAD